MHMTAQITPKLVMAATEPATHKSQSGVDRIVCGIVLLPIAHGSEPGSRRIG